MSVVPPEVPRARPDTNARVVIATRSSGKVAELIALMSSFGVPVATLAEVDVPESPDEDALEVFSTFEANALAKARYFSRLTGAIVLADDSGLAVDALEGRPGVHSKRWSGRTDLHGESLDAANNEFLQRSLAVAASTSACASRRARYVCAAACVGCLDDTTVEVVVRGETTGQLLFGPRGSSGFGYDPYFLSDDLGVTFAEATRAEKAVVSHRGRAFKTLMQQQAVRAVLRLP